MTSTDEKFKKALQRYEDDHAFIADLESRSRQKESEIKVLAGELVKRNQVIEQLKVKLATGTQEGTLLLENRKHLKAAIDVVMEQKKERYLKTVAAEDAIRKVDEQKSSNYRTHISYLEGQIDEKLRIGESFVFRMMEARKSQAAVIVDQYAAFGSMRVLSLVDNVEGDQAGGEVEEAVIMNE